MAKPRSKKGSNGNINGTDALSVTPAIEPTNNLISGQTVPVTASDAIETEKRPTSRKSSRKPEIVKTESRSNLFPINLEDEIRRLAYLLSERRGFEPGHETEDWLNAEHEVLERYQHQQTATA
jgi:hypothetical protein